jgi:DNA-binding transcriptional LysR family regulator
VALLYDFDLGEGVTAERLIDLQPYVLLAENSPLARRSVLSLEELARESLVLLDAPPSGNYFLSLFREARLEPNVRVRALSFEMVRGLAGHGFGYSLLTTKPASAMSYDGRALTARPLDVETTASRLVLTTHAHGSLAPAAAFVPSASTCLPARRRRIPSPVSFPTWRRAYERPYSDS